MRTITGFIMAAILITGCTSTKDVAVFDGDRKALELTSIGIRSAFSKADILTILSFHHPNVRKALGYKHFFNGREELKKDLERTFSYAQLTWLENKVESLIVHKGTAIEMTDYTIRITPKSGDKPFASKGRAMIVYLRSKGSPTG